MIHIVESSPERYDQKQLVEVRASAIDQARSSKKVGLILGALGRQGNLATVENLEQKLKDSGRTVVKIILSEIFPRNLPCLTILMHLFKLLVPDCR